jgi:holin-like protein
MQSALQPVIIDVADLTTGYLRSATVGLKGIVVTALQLLGLSAFNLSAVWVVEEMQLPIPGNLIGMVALYALLSLGIVKVAWFDAAGSFLVKHLGFFFIPIAVGVMDAGGLLAEHGIGTTLTLVVSAIIGIALTGLISQSLLGKCQRTGRSS